MEMIRKDSGINEMAYQTFTDDGTAQGTIQKVYNNLKSGKKATKDFTEVILSAKKFLSRDAGSKKKNQAYINNANKVLEMIKAQKEKLSPSQARMDTTKYS